MKSSGCHEIQWISVKWVHNLKETGQIVLKGVNRVVNDKREEITKTLILWNHFLL